MTSPKSAPRLDGPSLSLSSMVARLAGFELEVVAEGGLRAGLRGVDRGGAVQDVVVDPVLRIRASPLGAPKSARSSSRSRRRARPGCPTAASRRVPSSWCSATMAPFSSADAGTAVVDAPRPRVAKPQRRQHVELGRLGAGVAHGDADEDVVGRRLGVVGRDLPVRSSSKTPVSSELELAGRVPRGAVLVDEARRTGTRPAGTCSASASTSASASRRGTTSTPWRPRRGCPRRR